MSGLYIVVMNATHQSGKLYKFLSKRVAKSNESFTHTQIPNKRLHIYGGKWNIPESDIGEFNELYYDHVFIQKKYEFFTEKQLDKGGPILVDLDFRYDSEIEERQHTEKHVEEIIHVYLDNLKTIFKFENNKPFPVFIFEKPNVNMEDNVHTKDGIHIIICIQAEHALQIMLRKRVLSEIDSVFGDLPLENDYDDVLDQGITKGYTNWQLYGSRKPGNEAYKLIQWLTLAYDEKDGEFEWKKENIRLFQTKKDFMLLTARCNTHEIFSIREEVMAEYTELMLNKKNSKSAKRKKKSNTKIKWKKTAEKIDMAAISCESELDEAMELMLEGVKSQDNQLSGGTDYSIKEAHDYTMALPNTYYKPGSYDKWIRVGWALRNTADCLFITWMKFSSQSKDFSYDDIPDRLEQWNNFDQDTDEKLTIGSLRWWCKDSNKNIYDLIYKNTIGYYLNQTKNQNTDYDLAIVLYQMYKDVFICESIKNSTWFEFDDHKWSEIDSGTTLRAHISTDMVEKYNEKEQIAREVNKDHEASILYLAIINCLKKTANKDKIMREAKELFYVKKFMNKLDTNPFLLCCKNGVFDFKQNEFRDGNPQDYLSKCTNIDYRELDTIKDAKIIAEINNFFEELFPIKELREYMWDHLASCLIGNNNNQTFNIYTGRGANGKSVLVELMSMILGDYKGTVPITLITQKRNCIGSCSPEVVALMGTRYAVMQEPSKGDKINEGIMKELTGGDPIQGRALWQNSLTFVPQFNLVVCTNNLFDIKSNDDGTWRRLRVCDFISRFRENPDDNNPDEPYQFKRKKHMAPVFESWKHVFLAMLVERAKKTKGNVEDCPIVMATSKKYRHGQDYLAGFVEDNIKQVQGGKIKKTELHEQFKQWYSLQYGRKITPPGKELFEYMDKKFGKFKRFWSNVVIDYGDCDDDDED